MPGSLREERPDGCSYTIVAPSRADIAAACSTSSFCCRHVPCTRERSAIVGERIVLLPDAPMTPAMAGRVPPSAPSARDEPSVSEE